VETVKVAKEEYAGTLTLVTCTAALLLLSATVLPPGLGAATLNGTVPVAESPPPTVPGLKIKL